MSENKNSNMLAREVLQELLAMDSEQFLREIESAPEHELSQAVIATGVVGIVLSEDNQETRYEATSEEVFDGKVNPNSTYAGYQTKDSESIDFKNTELMVA